MSQTIPHNDKPLNEQTDHENKEKAMQEQTALLQKAEEIVARSGKDVLNAKRCWYQCKRWYFLALLVFFFWYSLIPMPMKITKESHHFEQPRFQNGTRVDYEKIYNDLQDRYLANPEENGFRDVLAAMGPRTLEQAYLAESVPWDKIPFDKGGKIWWNNDWLRLCKKLQIDPDPKPEYLDYVPLQVWLLVNGIRGDEPFLKHREVNLYSNYQQVSARITYAEARKADEDQMRKRPWTEQEFPQAVKWLERFNPLLEIFQRSVRKPVYSSFHYSYKDNHCAGSVLLPDIQAQRELCRAVRVRINYRLASGNMDGAIDDVIGILYLSDRMRKGVRCSVEHMVAMAMMREAFEEITLILQTGKLSKDQLLRLNQEFNTIWKSLRDFNPAEPLFDVERLVQLSWMQYSLDYPAILREEKWHSNFFDRDLISTWDERYILFALPVDKNIIMKTFHDDLSRAQEIILNTDPDYNRERAFEDLISSFDYLKTENRNWRYYWNLVSIKNRSRVYAGMFSVEMFCSLKKCFTVITLEETQGQMIQKSIAHELNKEDKRKR